jgi:integrase
MKQGKDHMTYEEINKLIRHMIGRMLIDYEDDCLTTKLEDEDHIDQLKEGNMEVIYDYGEKLYHWETPYHDDRRDQFLKEMGVTLNPEDRKRFTREYMKGVFKAHQLMNKRIDASDFNAGDEYIFEAEKSYSIVRISDIVRDHMQEQKPKVLEKTYNENVAIYQLFIHVCGDLNIKSINRKRLIDYRDTLAKLPPNMNKVKKYKNKSIKQILAMQYTPISTTTLNKHMTRLSSLFKWAEQNELMTTNPAEDLTISTTRKAHEERSPFTPEDLHKIFHSEGYQQDVFKHSYMFWLPLLALYSGCRLNEMCQLHLEDIRQDAQGVWVFDINDQGEKKLKNNTARRLVPIHDDLINIGLLDRVTALRAQGAEGLFPELPAGRDGHGKNASQWFARYRSKCGIEAPPRDKTMHSFRHTFADTFKQMDANMKHVSQILGHSTGDDQTNARYSNPFNPQLLKTKVMDRLHINEVDVELLSKSKWTGK